MKTNRITFVVIALFTIILGTGCDALESDSEESIQASGVVEANTVVVAPEVGGRISEVWAGEGDQLSEGDPLFRIEDEFLESQLHQAESALSVAQANFEMVAAGMMEEQQQAAIASAELELASALYALDLLYDENDLVTAQTIQAKKDAEDALDDLNNPELQQALALEAIAVAKKAIENAEKKLGITTGTANQADIDAAWAQVILSEKALEDAQEDFEDHAKKPVDNLTRANYQAKLSAAQQVYDSAVRHYNSLQSTGRETDISVAESELETAQAQLVEAQRDWDDIKDGPNSADLAYYEALIAYNEKKLKDLEGGPDPDDVVLAEARVANAEAQLALAKAETPTKEQLAVAQSQVNAARANLEAVQVQINKLLVTTPIDGVVMTRNVEVGEIARPGMSAMTIGQLEELTIKVYISENRYGQVDLGEIAYLTTNSFPDDEFEATVIRIADRAEYTPRNVQTAEDRATTVYAIELSVNDSSGKLKPGMQVDLHFE
ncbi:efflux RND transporter periplasmic adaptor subunit [Chloroflexota bacterium]